MESRSSASIGVMGRRLQLAPLVKGLAVQQDRDQSGKNRSNNGGPVTVGVVPASWRLRQCLLTGMVSGALGLGLGAPLAGQTIRGLVTDAVTGSVIPLATATLVAESGERLSSVLTTEEGFYLLTGDGSGLYLVRVAAPGYLPGRAGPLELGSDDAQVLEIRLEAAPIGLEGLVVEGQRQGASPRYLNEKGFWARYEEGRGQFLTPGEVLASDAMFTPHLFRGLEQVVPQYGVAPWSMWPMLGISEHRACVPRTFVDDVWVNRPNFGIAEGTGLDDIVPIDRVLAVEVYRGPFQAPMRYQGTTYDNECGVVLIWTR